MKSFTTDDFWEMFYQLPLSIQELAREKYELWKVNPLHPSLQFKKIRGNVYSARITDSYRSVGVIDNGEIVWFFIGTHTEYDNLLSKL
jgi:hypothetical protein